MRHRKITVLLFAAVISATVLTGCTTVSGKTYNSDESSEKSCCHEEKKDPDCCGSKSKENSSVPDCCDGE